MHTNRHELSNSGATTKNLLTTEDTKEHEGEPKPKLTAEVAKDAESAERRHGENQASLSYR